MDACSKPSENFFFCPNIEKRAKDIAMKYFGSGVMLNSTIYTDGVSTFEYSRYSIWPIYLVINNLPPKQRYSLNNIILCGVWYGKIKPNIQLLFEIVFLPLLPKLNSKFAFNVF